MGGLGESPCVDTTSRFAPGGSERAQELEGDMGNNGEFCFLSREILSLMFIWVCLKA